jgi:hypothetical protein
VTIIYLAVTAIFSDRYTFDLSESTKNTTMKLTVFVLTVLFLGIVILPHSGNISSEKKTEWQCKVPAPKVSLDNRGETSANKDQSAPVSSEFSGKHANTVIFIL